MISFKHLREAQAVKAGVHETDVYGAKAYHAKCMEPGCEWESKRYDRIKQAQAAAQKHAQEHMKPIQKENVEKVNEVSTELLARYKKAAAAQASEADKAGNFEKGNKRYSGIIKATKKQFKNETK